jgi:hypothetical protein
VSFINQPYQSTYLYGYLYRKRTSIVSRACACFCCVHARIISLCPSPLHETVCGTWMKNFAHS